MSEEFSMQNGRTLAFVLRLRDPHVFESGQRSKDGTADPRGIETFVGSRDAQLSVLWAHALHFQQ